MSVQLRTCQTCPDTRSDRCIFVNCRDAVAIGRCHYGEVNPPVPCRTCNYRNPDTGTQGLASQICTSCMQAGFAAWTLGTNIATRPTYVPMR